jgi:hypothetical protein
MNANIELTPTSETVSFMANTHEVRLKTNRNANNPEIPSPANLFTDEALQILSK